MNQRKVICVGDWLCLVGWLVLMSSPAVARPLIGGFVLPKNAVVAGLAVDTKRSTHFRDGDGRRLSRPAGMSWHYSRLWLELNQGFSTHVSLYGRVPLVVATMELGEAETIRTIDIGDAHLGFVAEPWRAGPHSLAFSADLKVPSGLEWPSAVGVSKHWPSILTGTGTTDLGGHIHGALVFSERLRLGVQLGYTHRFSGVVGYVYVADGPANGAFSPGDVLSSAAQVLVALGPKLNFGVGVDYRGVQDAMFAGGSDVGPRLNTHTGGNWVDGRLILGVEPGESIGFELWLGRDLIGGDTRPFAHMGLEALSPQPGFSLGARGMKRW
jgi:hypothetical protein